MSACVFPLRSFPDFVRSSALAWRRHVERFLQCFLFFLRGFLTGRSKPCIVNCPERRITSRPEGARMVRRGRREEIFPSGVTVTRGLLIASTIAAVEKLLNFGLFELCSFFCSSSHLIVQAVAFHECSFTCNFITKISLTSHFFTIEETSGVSVVKIVTIEGVFHQGNHPQADRTSL